MKPGLHPLRAQTRPICQLCAHILHQPTNRRAFLAVPTVKTSAIRQQPARKHGAFTAMPIRAFASRRRAQPVQTEVERPDPNFEKPISVTKRLELVEKHIQAIFDSPKVEPEDPVIHALNELEYIAKRAIAIRGNKTPSPKLTIRQSSAAAILSLDTDDAPKAASKPTPPEINDLPSPAYLSRLAMDLVKHEKVFISPDILSKFVDLQSLLGKPRTIPEIFHLYANKPVPLLGSSPPTYTKRSPRGFKQHIPRAVADKALETAIAHKDMLLALNMVDTSFCAPAWKTYKYVTKVLPPAIFATLAPIVCYTLANEISEYNGYLDQALFKWYSFAGLMTYMGCTGTLGYIALTTWNDHHDRVCWQPGTPLTERMVREDERASLDRIASAWGFKETWKRGDEEGEDWEGLKEWCWVRGMELDKPELMPGMNP